jgi:hypothetical protein
MSTCWNIFALLAQRIRLFWEILSSVGNIFTDLPDCDFYRRLICLQTQTRMRARSLQQFCLGPLGLDWHLCLFLWAVAVELSILNWCNNATWSMLRTKLSGVWFYQWPLIVGDFVFFLGSIFVCVPNQRRIVSRFVRNEEKMLGTRRVM